MFVGADLDFCLPAVDVVHEVFGSAEDLGCVEDGARSVREGVVLGVVLAARSPRVDVRLQRIPVRVAAGGVGLADSGVAVADADGVAIERFLDAIWAEYGLAQATLASRSTSNFACGYARSIRLERSGVAFSKSPTPG